MEPNDNRIRMAARAGRDAIKRITAKIDKAEKRSAMIIAEMAELTNAGMEPGSIFMKADKYAYIVEPMVDGERTRTYIGTDPDKIKAAQTRLDNWAKHQAKQQELAEIASQLQEMMYHLIHAE